MVARLQGFPDTWQFAGRKTAAYRQVGNAFPPPVARAVARDRPRFPDSPPQLGALEREQQPEISDRAGWL